MKPWDERNWRLEPSGFERIDRLFRAPAFPDAWPTMFFVEAMREAFEYHYAHSEVFRGHADLAGFRAADMRSLEDVERMPWIHVQNFKEAELHSVGPKEILLTLTSSGTQGAKTKLFLDATSLNRLRVAAYEVYRGLGVLRNSDKPCNALLFTYDIEHASTLGTAWTDAMIAEMSATSETVYLIRKRGEEFAFDMELALSTYLRFVKSGLPLRILGFPAFISRFLHEAERLRVPKLAPAAAADSWILTGGGWKNHRSEAIPKPEFARYVEAQSGIPAAQVRDLFGMSEHGVGYVDCERGRLHIPVYSHAVTRDPFTLKVLPPGQPGMLQLFSPLLKSYPSISLLTTDEARIDTTPCPCGRPGAGLEILGRLGLQKYEGCAIRALEVLSA